MSYVTIPDMLLEFSEIDLIDLTNPGAESVDADKLNAAIDRATALVNTYIVKHLTLPLDAEVVAKSPLKGINADIAYYYLFDGGAGVPDVASNRYKDAVAWLRDFATGRVSLGAENQEPSGNASITARSAEIGSRFNWNAY